MTRNARLFRSRHSQGGASSVAISPWLPIDAALWAAMLLLAVWVRFDFSVESTVGAITTPRVYWMLLGLVALSSVLGWQIGLYKGRYVPGSLLEATVLAFLVAGVTAIVFLIHIVSGQSEGVPRSTPIVTGAFTTLAALILRSFARRRELFGAGAAHDAEPAIVFGAGDGGHQLVRQLRRSNVINLNPVGILDDDGTKKNMLIDGVRVHGGRDKMQELADRTGASALVVAVPSLASEELIDIRNRAESIGLHVLVLPPLDSMIQGRVAADELREINVNDLLGRKPARLNQTQIASYIRGKRVLVTGAGGSIGSELCRQLVQFRPADLMMLDRDESGLHAVQLSISDQAMLDGDDTILASIRDRHAIHSLIKERQPQIVFHAAALKHMPLLEKYPLEALKTNVLGTLNLLEAAAGSGVETFVNISTDKAANPCSVLGKSKRIAERLTAAMAADDSGAKYVSVRFGNVLGSRGSVLTVFEKQIQDGGPVTVTDPDVNRFFMTIPEACQLVLQAAVVGESGETLVLDMGDPVRISDVANTLIQQSGKNIEIVYTGLRDKEKLAEELFDDSEALLERRSHEAVSEVKVEPLTLNRSSAQEINEHLSAMNWLNHHVNVPDQQDRTLKQGTSIQLSETGDRDD